MLIFRLLKDHLVKGRTWGVDEKGERVTRPGPPGPGGTLTRVNYRSTNVPMNVPLAYPLYSITRSCALTRGSSLSKGRVFASNLTLPFALLAFACGAAGTRKRPVKALDDPRVARFELVDFGDLEPLEAQE